MMSQAKTTDLTRIGAVFFYNYFASIRRAVGNSAAALLFLGVSVFLNIGLDLLFVLQFHWGVAGAAAAIVIAQWFSGIGIWAVVSIGWFLADVTGVVILKKDRS